jgi:hypothetical protein
MQSHVIVPTIKSVLLILKLKTTKMHTQNLIPVYLQFLYTYTYTAFVMKTNLMHYLSLIYFVSQYLHVTGIFIAHHQEVFTVNVQQLVHVKCLTFSHLTTYTYTYRVFHDFRA